MLNLLNNPLQSQKENAQCLDPEAPVPAKEVSRAVGAVRCGLVSAANFHAAEVAHHRDQAPDLVHALAVAHIQFVLVGIALVPAHGPILGPSLVPGPTRGLVLLTTDREWVVAIRVEVEVLITGLGPTLVEDTFVVEEEVTTSNTEITMITEVEVATGDRVEGAGQDSLLIGPETHEIHAITETMTEIATAATAAQDPTVMMKNPSMSKKSMIVVR